jgi:nitrous oxidase accessory protein NosD
MTVSREDTMHSVRVAGLGLVVTTTLIGAATSVGEASGVDPASTIVVHQGESIQAAVNRAASGDTILIEPGHYHQSVLVAKNDLRIKGSGSTFGGTVIEPAAIPRGYCAKQAKSGICVLDPSGQRTIVGTTIQSLRVRNFEGDGVVGTGVDGFVVDNVVAHNNARYGITMFNSTRAGFFDNKATGSGDAGIYVGDSPDANVTILGNEVWNNGFGILMRNAQHGDIELNNVHDNCIGIFIWWLPGVAGDSTVAYNAARHNNKFCKHNDEVRFNYSGSGIALMGAHNVLVAQNAVNNNRGRTPVSGGIVLVSGEFDGGPPSSDNTIKHNTAFGDAPADIVDHSGGANTFVGNRCFTSMPDGLCR